MTELKPCPFCGGEAEFYPAACIEQGWYIATVQCVSCAAQVCSKPGLDRAEQEANESAIKAWNTRAERTCHSVSASSNFFQCSECGCEIMFTVDGWKPLYMGRVNYCPNCGAKVVE